MPDVDVATPTNRGSEIPIADPHTMTDHPVERHLVRWVRIYPMFVMAEWRVLAITTIFRETTKGGRKLMKLNILHRLLSINQEPLSRSANNIIAFAPRSKSAAHKLRTKMLCAVLKRFIPMMIAMTMTLPIIPRIAMVA